MTQEEKAKAYDRALERARVWKDKSGMPKDKQGILDDIFPELREPEDEKIRKELIEFIKSRGGFKQEYIAWLEKQGDKDKLIKELGEYKVKYTQEVLESYLNSMNNKDDERLRKTTIAFLKDFAEQGYENAVECIDWLEKQGQKPQGKSALEAINEAKVDNAIKAESRFHESDWISGYYNNYKVAAINSKGYVVEDTDGSKINIPFENEQFHHLFTIADAKDGDVLACNEEILLFKSYSVQGRISLYCWYNGQTNNFHSKEVDDTLLTTRNKICPATKEQRDLLFSKMKEAGYTWNDERKELRKFPTPADVGFAELGKAWEEEAKDKKPTWSEEDERNMQNIDSVLFYDKSLSEDTCMRLRNWLKTIKQRIGGEK